MCSGQMQNPGSDLVKEECVAVFESVVAVQSFGFSWFGWITVVVVAIVLRSRRFFCVKKNLDSFDLCVFVAACRFKLDLLRSGLPQGLQ